MWIVSVAAIVSWQAGSFSGCGIAHHRVARPTAFTLAMDAAGVPDVKWFPVVDAFKPDSEPTEGATTMPLFPLGAAYLPGTDNLLNIFEPRYRQMYDDILLSGSRRFMVTNVDQDSGRLAEVGVIFHLDELKEVSEQTKDRVKYIGQHSVIGRAKLVQVLNPSSMRNSETYLRAQVEELVDESESEPELLQQKQEEAKQLFWDLVDAQTRLDEQPRFTESVKNSISFKACDPDAFMSRISSSGGRTKLDIKERGLWGTIVLWQQFLEQRSAVVGQKMEKDIQSKILEYLKKEGLIKKLASSRLPLSLKDLPPELISAIKSIQKRHREELQDLDCDPHGEVFQVMLQAESHRDRLAIFSSMLETEHKRLVVRLKLQTLFDSS